MGGIGILGFIENNNRIEFANAARGFRVLEKLIGQRDLVGISNDAAFQAEIAVVALHFGGDADGGLVHPATQRHKGLLPDLIDALCLGAANRPPQKAGPFPIAFFPRLKLRDGIRDRVALLRHSGRAVNVLQIYLGTRTLLGGTE